MICGLDIGSSKIKVILAKERPLELVAKKEIESEGVRRGIVIESD
jgi:cell division ATPase FtsA